MFKIITPFFLFIAFFSFTASADFKKGFKAYQNKDYRTAHREFLEDANKGVEEAQYNLGLLYEGGLGITQDYVEASRWFRKAANKGHILAQYNMGLKHDLGNGLLQDYKEAVRWYNMAAEQGHDLAQYALGIMYF